MKTGLIVSSLVLPLALAACAGGGGGGGGSSTPVTPPPAPVPVTVSGNAISGTYTLNNTTRVGNVALSAVDNTASLTTTGLAGRNGATSNVTSATISSTNAAVAPAGNSLTVNGSSNNFANGFTLFDPKPNQIYGNTAAIQPIAGAAVAYTYLTYGTWFNCGSGCGTTNETGVSGWYVAGQQTPSASIPVSGSATYIGTTDGNFFNGISPSQRVQADLQVVATFGNPGGSLTFTTNNTQLQNLQTNAITLAPNLNMNGTLTYGAGSNQFTGSVTDGVHSGSATGRFYGPTASEVGGVYSLTGGGQTNVGSFVAK